jgi:hypothetical protein
VFNNEKPSEYNEKIFNRKEAEINNLMVLQNYHAIQKPCPTSDLLIDWLLRVILLEAQEAITVFAFSSPLTTQGRIPHEKDSSLGRLAGGSDGFGARR